MTRSEEALQEENEALRQQVAHLEAEGRRKDRVLQAIIDNIPSSVIYVRDTDWTFTVANQAHAAIMGATPADIVGKHDYDLFPETLVKEFRHYDEQLLASGEHQDSEEVVPTGSEERTYRSVKFPIRDEDGTIFAVGGLSINVTAQKQAEDALLRNQRLLQGVIDNSPSIIYAKDRNWNYMLANRQFAGLTGMEPEQIIGKNDYDLFPTESADGFRGNDQQVLAGGKPMSLEERLQQKDGDHVYLSIKFPLVDASGEIYGVCGISTDISERKQAEEELRIFKSLVENAPDGVCVVNPADNRVFYTNPAYRDIVQYGDEIIGLAGQELLAVDEAEFNGVNSQVGEQGSWRGVLNCLRKDGTTVPTHQSIFLIHNQQQQAQAIAMIARDISEQQRQEEERTALQDQIIEAQRSALRELSTPLIPLSHNVVMMPLIGSIDSGRAQLVMETLLEGIAMHQADMAILDITGVSVVDTQVANALVQTAQAVRLLGARVVLTGIGPTMAQTLVHLGADLSTIQTRGNLQQAVIEALTQGAV